MSGATGRRTSPGFAGIALVLLAAGHGRRFGGGKLRAPLAGRPLAHHAAATLAALPFACRIAVVGTDDLDLPRFGFSCLAPEGDDYPMSASLACGVTAAAGRDASAVMIALADMPLVSAGHVIRLVENFRGSRIASRDGAHLAPPAIFGRQWFGRLRALDGDKGARALLRRAPGVTADPLSLADIDTAEDLHGVARRLSGSPPP